MSLALTRKRWDHIDGLGRVEVLGDRADRVSGMAAPSRSARKSRAAKTETLDFQSFMQGEQVVIAPQGSIKPKDWSRLRSLPLVPLALAPLVPVKAFAQEIGDPSIQAKMMTAFTPIIELVQALAYPVALLVVLGGGLMVIIGGSEKGFSLIQRAGLGYVLVMMLPMMLDVLVDAMSSVV